MKKTPERFQEVLDLIRTLRGEGGCPWDRKQTIESLTKYVHSEFEELAEALDAQAPDQIQEEMGDLIFLLLFVSEIAREKGQFAIDDVLDHVIEKMIGRHPHVFGDVSIDGVQDVKENWKKIKVKEKLRASQQTLVERMPRNLPALQQALWAFDNINNGGGIENDPLGTLNTIEKKTSVLRAAVRESDRETAAVTIGGLLFSLVAVSRSMEIKPQGALRAAIRRFLEDSGDVKKTFE